MPPDLVAEPTFDDYAHNRDPAMAAIFEAIQHEEDIDKGKSR